MFSSVKAVSPVGFLFLFGILMVINLDIVDCVLVFGRITPSQYVSRYFSLVTFRAFLSLVTRMTPDRLPYQATAGFD